MNTLNHLLTILLICFSMYSKAQSFKKDDKLIEAGFGLGIYDTKINNKKEDKAAAWVLPVSFEYAYHKRLAVGIAYKYSSFITGNDSINKNENMNGHDLVVKPTFHFVTSKTIDMYVGALAGIARINYQVNDIEQSAVKGNGAIVALIFGTRFYVSKKMSISLNYAFNSYSFKNLTVSNNQGYSDQLDLNLLRGNVAIGFSYKFKNQE